MLLLLLVVMKKITMVTTLSKHQMVDIRGNVGTRIQKLKDSNWDGAIFAAAGLDTSTAQLKHEIGQSLDWMIHAPGQGASSNGYT